MKAMDLLVGFESIRSRDIDCQYPANCAIPLTILQHKTDNYTTLQKNTIDNLKIFSGCRFVALRIYCNRKIGISPFFLMQAKVKTTGEAGGLHRPYKGLIPAAP